MARILLPPGFQHLRRQLGTQVVIGSASLPFSALLGIAVGGAVLLFSILLAVIVIVLGRRHRRAMGLIMEANEARRLRVETKTIVRSSPAPQAIQSNRLSFNPFLPAEDSIPSPRWPIPIQPEIDQGPPMAKAKRHSRDFFRKAKNRDSWPLVSGNIPLCLLPGSRDKINTSPVAPPGYVVDEPRPKRSGSRFSKRNGSISSISKEDRPRSPSHDPHGAAIPSRKLEMRRRAISENQLSTILRSTSQRLKASHRLSMTRTLSTFGSFPGLPPAERLPTPPIGKPSAAPAESREALVEKEYPESPESSVYDFFRRTPSPGKGPMKRSSLKQSQVVKSPTPSNESRNSLYGVNTSDLIINSPLSSPSKRGIQGTRKHADVSVAAKKTRMPSFTSRGPPTMKILDGHSPSPIPNALFSTVKSAKPSPASNGIQVQAPQPSYVRKATFGNEITTSRPNSVTFPLNDVSSNIRTASPLKSTSDEPSPTGSSRDQAPHNPFNWSPQEAMKAYSAPSNLKSEGQNLPRKSHKRSNTIHMSVLSLTGSRPTSTVEVVPEEPEEEAPLRLVIPRNNSVRFEEPVKPSTFASSRSKQRSVRPPTSAVFESRLPVPGLASASSDHSLRTSPIPGVEVGLRVGLFERYSPGYLKSCKTTDSSPSTTEPAPESGSEIRQLQVASQSPNLFPSRLPVKQPSPTIILPLQIPSALSTTVEKQPPSPSDLSTPTPARLIGPREPPRRFHSLNVVKPSPPRDSVQASIAILRRMNSAASSFSASPYTGFTDIAEGEIDSDNPTMAGGRKATVLTGDNLKRFRTDDQGEGEISDDVEDRAAKRLSMGSSLALSIDLQSNRPRARDSTVPEMRGRPRGYDRYLNLGVSGSGAVRETVKSHYRPRDSHKVYKERRTRDEIRGVGTKQASRNDLAAVSEGDANTPSPSGKGAMASGAGFEVGDEEVTGGGKRARECFVIRSPPPFNIKPLSNLKGELDEKASGNREYEQEEVLGRRFSQLTPTAEKEVMRRMSQMESPRPTGGMNVGLGILGLAGEKLVGGGYVFKEEDSWGIADGTGYPFNVAERSGKWERSKGMRVEGAMGIENQRKEVRVGEQ